MCLLFELTRLWLMHCNMEEEFELCWRKQCEWSKHMCFVLRLVMGKMLERIHTSSTVRYGGTYRRSTQVPVQVQVLVQIGSDHFFKRACRLLCCSDAACCVLLCCCLLCCCSDAQQVEYKLDLIHLTSPVFSSSSASSYLYPTWTFCSKLWNID